jgi:hypothetical protein
MRSRCASGCGGSDDLFTPVSPCSTQTLLPAFSLLSNPMLESAGISRTATPAERVRLVVALSETGSSLRCIAVSLEVWLKGAGGRAAYSLWARNCTRK